MGKSQLTIAMLGHKHIFSREGGIEIVVKELATRMAEKGHQVICYDRSTTYVSENKENKTCDKYKNVKIVPVWTIPKKGLAALTSSISAAVLAGRSNADVVHIHAEGPAAMTWIPKQHHKRVIVTVHGLDWQRDKWGRLARKYIKWGEKQAVKKADEIIVLSKNVQNYFRKKYNRETIFIPNGVEKHEIRRAQEIKELWGLDKDSYVLYLGRIVPEKGLQYLVAAWRKIKTEKKLVIAGDSSDADSFMKRIKKGISDNVIFVGFQQGTILEELYSNAYIYVLPSDLEGMPLSLLEAMSYGNCCVVSNIPECIEVIEDKAIAFRKSDTENLRETLQDLIIHQEKVSYYKSIAAEYVIKKYNWDNIVDRTIELYMG